MQNDTMCGLGDYLAAIRKEWANAGLLCDDQTSENGICVKNESSEDAVKKCVREQRFSRFREICPAEFAKKIDRSRIKNLDAWDDADKWEGAFPGLWIWSHETGLGKTRMLWRKFGHLHVNLGRVIVKSSGQNLVERYFEYHMDGNPSAFYGWLLRHEVVMIDDIDKVDLDDKRARQMMRELFDRMYEANKLILVTANEPIAEMERRLGLSGGRRMRELCREVHF